jgi:hypothetical protein
MPHDVSPLGLLLQPQDRAQRLKLLCCDGIVTLDLDRAKPTA